MTTPRRNAPGIAYATCCLIASLFLLYLAISRDGWWLLALIPGFVLGMLGGGGLAHELTTRDRNTD